MTLNSPIYKVESPPIPPSSDIPSKSREHRTPDMEKRIRHNQQRLLLLRHASKCEAPDGYCKVTPHCTEMKRLWKHLSVCQERNCPFPHCGSSRCVLSHYRRCKDVRCPTCVPVRETIKKSNEKDKRHDEFLERMKDAMKRVETILANTRNPRLASPDVPHTYHDKFTLSEFLSKVAIQSFWNVFEKLGCDNTSLRHFINAVSNKKKSVTLRFTTNETCEFLKEDTVEISNPNQLVETFDETTQDGQKKSSTTTRKVVTTVQQYHWKFTVHYAMYMYIGTDTQVSSESNKVLLQNNVSCELVTSGSRNQPPISIQQNTIPFDVSLTWMLQHVDAESLNVNFGIDRDVESCRTPRHNNEVHDAWTHWQEIHDWCTRVNDYFLNKEREVSNCGDTSTKLSMIDASNIFVPVLPLLEENNNDSTTTSLLFSTGDVNQFLKEQCRTMSEEIKVVLSQTSESITSSNVQPFMSSDEAVLVLLNSHLKHVAEYWFLGTNHIEDMLCNQLFTAVGKSVTAADLKEFVKFHQQVIFSDTYAPEPFCYAIRRPNHYPDGIISIEDISNANNESAMTFTRKLESRKTPMHIPINSATFVEFTGDMYLHAWMLQRFKSAPPAFSLASRARQFSSFLLLIGNLSGPDTFEPQHGIILQNKDEILIPLLLEEIPSPKEFKDAISSLSPEQQRFAKSFRNMKLSSSVFGLCVIQLKPQLEILLGLPNKSLTKEIRLTQDLLSLFIEYQIPSDLLSYDNADNGSDNLAASDKVNIVKDHVQNVFNMIKGTKEKELANAEMESEMKKVKESQLPPGWKELVDPSSGNPYYCNETDGSTSWDKPYKNTWPPSMMSIGRINADADVMMSLAPQSFGSSTPACIGSGHPTYEALSFGAAAPANTFGSAAPAAAFGSTAPASTFGSTTSTATYGSAPQIRSHSSTQPSSVAKPALQSETSSTSITDSTMNLDDRNISVNLNALNINKDDDLTMIPKLLDAQFETNAQDERYGGSLRSTVIKTGGNWKKTFKPNILSKAKSITLNSTKLKTEKDNAFDLLDALSRSGSLPIACAELHVIVASTHCFEKSVVNTIVQDNINPIEKIERSNLLVASVIHNVPVVELLRNKKEFDRIAKVSPGLIDDGATSPL